MIAALDGVDLIVFTGRAVFLSVKEQTYNLQGANTYLGVIIPLAVLSVILPDYTETTGPTLSFAQESTLAVISIGLYCAFLAVQTGRYRGYFTLGARR